MSARSLRRKTHSGGGLFSSRRDGQVGEQVLGAVSDADADADAEAHRN